VATPSVANNPAVTSMMIFIMLFPLCLDTIWHPQARNRGTPFRP
jgi:hypothetical protein